MRNTMYERLTKWEVNGCASVNGCSPIDKDMANAINRLCEIEDKICEGRMLELPCKVWQTVYVPWEWEGQKGIASTIVECIQIVRDAELRGFFIDMKSDDTAFNDVYGFWRTFDDIGKKIFLTREEAEKALAERKEE